VIRLRQLTGGCRSPLGLGLRAGLALAVLVAIGSAAVLLGTRVKARPAPARASSGLEFRKRYYVDCSGGADSNNGTTPSSAWDSLDRASSAPLKPGDALLLADGCTFNGTLRASWNGTASAGITVGSYGAGRPPVIHQNLNDSQDIAVTGRYLTIRDLDLTASPPSVLADCDNAAEGWIVGVIFQPGATHDTLTDSRLSGFYAGAYLETGANDNLVTHSVFSGNNMMSPNTKNRSSGAFGVLIGGDNNTISHNEIDGGNQCSLAYGFDGSAVEVFGGRNNLIEYNTASDDNVFTELGNSRSSGNVYAYNLFDTSTPDQGFVTTRGANSADGPVTSTMLYNNTAYETGTGDQGVVCYAGCSPKILTMENNIINTSGQALYSDGPFQSSNNIFWGGSPSADASVPDAESMVRNPEFCNPSAGAFSLEPGSPALGAGAPLPASLGLDADLAGAPVTKPPSIGAYGVCTARLARAGR
jgi:hypothetical protein